MEFDELPFFFRMLVHWAICGVLIWVGWNNEDATLLLVIIGWVSFIFCYNTEFQQGSW